MEQNISPTDQCERQSAKSNASGISFQDCQINISERNSLQQFKDNISTTQGNQRNNYKKIICLGVILSFAVLIIIVTGVNHYSNQLKNYQFESQMDKKIIQSYQNQLQIQKQISSKIEKIEKQLKNYQLQSEMDKKVIESYQNQLQIQKKISSKIEKIEKQLNTLSTGLQISQKTNKNLQINTVKISDQFKQSDNDKKIKFKVRQKFRSRTPQKPKQRDYYQFTIPLPQLVKKNSNPLVPNDTQAWTGIKKSEYQRAIKLMQVVHNVNFKGEFVFDHFNFYPSPEAKAEALSKILQQEKQYYDKKYEINKYAHDQIGICIFVTSYNNAKNRLYLRNLDSIFQQDYKNYHVVYANDASTDGTGEYVKAYMEENQIPRQKYDIIDNKVNLGNLPNTRNAVFNYCKEGQILATVDGDDALIGRQALSLINAVYQKEKVALTYGQFLLVNQERNQAVMRPYSKYIPQKNLQQGTFRQLKIFCTAHLRTMYVDVFRQIKQEDFKDNQGVYYYAGSDVVFMTPSVQLVGKRLKYVTELIYEYRFGTGNNESSKKQSDYFSQVMAKKPYKKMESMPFADNPKSIHYP